MAAKMMCTMYFRIAASRLLETLAGNSRPARASASTVESHGDAWDGTLGMGRLGWVAWVEHLGSLTEGLLYPALLGLRQGCAAQRRADRAAAFWHRDPAR